MTRIMICIFSLCITGCASIPGFYSGYKRLSPEDKQRVKYLENRNIDTLRNDGNIYLVKAADILDYVKKKDKVVIYDWGVNCCADVCVPLDVMEKFCKEKGLELLVIMEYYGLDLIPTPENFSKPVFFIDTKYYRSDYCNKYAQRFYKDLSGKTFKELNYRRHYYFENGRFEGTYDNRLLDYLQKTNFKVSPN